VVVVSCISIKQHVFKTYDDLGCSVLLKSVLIQWLFEQPYFSEIYFHSSCILTVSTYSIVYGSVEIVPLAAVMRPVSAVMFHAWSPTVRSK